ncbi:MAG: LysE family transporter [Chloroflexi bacterium]|nr:LysE family transporter [Chloroflexota bacterium]
MPMLFLSAFAMSVAFAAQPGVVMFETIRRGVTGGWRPALLLALGSLVGDGVWTLIALAGASVLFQSRLLTILLGGFGAVLLLRFARDAYQTSRQTSGIDSTGSAVGKNHLMAGAALSLSNPMNLTFWLGMSGTLIGLGFLDPEPEDFVVFFVGFMSAQVLYCFLLAWLVTLGRKILSPGVWRYVLLGSAGILAYFGVTLAFSTLQALLA